MRLLTEKTSVHCEGLRSELHCELSTFNESIIGYDKSKLKGPFTDLFESLLRKI